MKILEQYKHLAIPDKDLKIFEKAISLNVLRQDVTFNMGYYSSYNPKTKEQTCCMIGRLDTFLIKITSPEGFKIYPQITDSLSSLTNLSDDTAILYTRFWEKTKYNESKYLEHLYRYSFEHGVIDIEQIPTDNYYKLYDSESFPEILEKIMQDLLELNPLEES